MDHSWLVDLVSAVVMNALRLVEFLLMMVIISCGVFRAETLPASPTGSGLEGTVLLHTVSGGPVRQGVPDSKPLPHTTFTVTKEGETIATFTTDDQGHFRIALPPGRYSISRKDWKSRVGFYGPFTVEVATGEMNKVRWDCDTGMQ